MFGAGRTILFALILTLTATLLSSSTPHPFATLDVPVALSPAVAPAIPTNVGTPAGSQVAENVEDLAGVIARKYRISQDATREMVIAAFREGKRNGLDPLLIVAVMAVESRFNPIAQSDMGAIGLMQIIPRFHADKLEAGNAASVLDPNTNIQVGARVLKEYIRRSGSQEGGLQLYNGTPYDESAAYANKVLDVKERLRQAVQRLRRQA
jgi:soluble lytic murein transglycosylase-like protein